MSTILCHKARCSWRTSFLSRIQSNPSTHIHLKLLNGLLSTDVLQLDFSTNAWKITYNLNFENKLENLFLGLGWNDKFKLSCPTNLNCMEYCREMWEIFIAMGCTTNMVEKKERNMKEIWAKYVRNPHCNGLHNKYGWEIWERSGSGADLRSNQSNMGAKMKCGRLQNIWMKSLENFANIDQINNKDQTRH